MDPLTHVVIGRAVVAAGGDGRRSRAIGAAAILGALSPDIDSVIAFSGWDRYVRAHQFGTHSILGTMTMAAVTAVVVERSANALARRPDEPRAKASAERFPTIFGAALAGALSHIALDLISGARIAILWPLLSRRVSLPLVAMADPWLVVISILWLLMLWPARIEVRRASQVVVSATVIFLCFKAAMLGVALRHVEVAADGGRAVEARWGSLTDWFVFERSHDEVRMRSIASRGPAVFVLARPLGADTPLVQASRSLEDVRNFLAVHEFAFPAETKEDDGRVSVMWSDLRYCWSTGCGVWVGGTFDVTGRAIAQEIRVGSVVQRRP